MGSILAAEDAKSKASPLKEKQLRLPAPELAHTVHCSGREQLLDVIWQIQGKSNYLHVVPPAAH